MSTSDGRPLTRRQLRELRQTGQTPIITDEQAEAALHARTEEGADAAEADTEARDAEHAADGASEVAADEDGAAEDAEAAHEDDPASDASDDPADATHAPESADGARPEQDHEREQEPVAPSRPLTRRELRERLRTGTVPTITGEIVAEEPQQETDEAVADAEERTEALVEVEAEVADDDTVEATIVGEEHVDEAPAEEAPGDAPAEEEQRPGFVVAPVARPDEGAPEGSRDEAPVVRPGFGAHLAEEKGEPPIVRPPATSFDDLIVQPHESGGSSSAPSALIIDDAAAAALNAPITATGELIITSSHKLPDGFGSRGVAKGTTDGREVDAVLIDGELPLASSPTPIAASEAISTSKSPGEVIRPPAPEKNHRLVLTLGITAGALGIVVVGAVIIAYATGVLG